MALIAYEQARLDEFRRQLSLYGMDLSAAGAWELVRTVGDWGVATDAMLMRPRPEWLVKIAGAPES